MARHALLTITSLYMLSLPVLSAQEQVLHPRAMPSEVEIVNPLRGLYTWLNYHMAPQPEPALDYYQRIPWNALEPEQSRYDFALIEKELSKLPKGGRFAFRIMALNSSWSWKDGSDVPEYLMEKLPRGFYVPAVRKGPKSPSRLYIPDWNSPIFLDRAEKLLSALGDKYDGDPRIAFIDIGIYGTWGEWHVYGIPNFPASMVPYKDGSLNTQNASPGTFESRRRIIDAHARAFKKTRLLMPVADTKEDLVYALRLPTPIPIGLRRDSFGARQFSETFVTEGMSQADRDLVLNRWRTAPLIVESFGPPKAFQVGPQGLVEQVESYHVAAIGNGNFGNWNNQSLDEQNAVLNAGKRSGYRFAITGATLPQDIKSGRELSLRTQWINQGVTPAYEPWTVEFSLWNQQGNQCVGQAVSTVNLEALLPGSRPFEVRDVLRIKKHLSRGAYDLRVKITDPAHYRNPLRLATEGATPDGSYSLGAVQVQ